MWPKLQLVRTILLAGVIGVLLAGGGCSPQAGGDGVGDGSTIDLQHAQDEFALADAGADQLTQLLDNGVPVEDALNTLADSLSQDPRVAAAALQDDGAGLWVAYHSGLEHVYWVVEEDDFALNPQASTGAASLTSAGRLAAQNPLPRSADVPRMRDAAMTTAQLGLSGQYKLPANNKVVLANALHVTIPLQDVRQPIETMLTACGYDVHRVDADVEFFKNMSQFGVIFIEAHGGVRPSSKLPESREAGTDMGISTSVPVTFETFMNFFNNYLDDIYRYGRIRESTVEVKRKGLPTQKFNYWAITPAFVRKYNPDKFPDYALLCLSACRSFTVNGSSWADLMYEKSFGSVVVGWDDHVHYGISARAMLHLFQFLAGTDQQFDITEISPTTGVKTILPLLFKNDYAPVLPQTLSGALSGLEAKSFDQDPATLARLRASGDTLSGPTMLILAPAIETFETLGDGNVRLGGRCADNAELRFGDSDAINIGTASNGTWTFPLAARYSGPMSLHLQDRKCPPRDLLRWYPVVVRIRMASPTDAWGTCNSEATYQLSLRAIASGHRDSRQVWDKPESALHGQWDPDASTVTWSVNGNKTVPDDLFGPSQCTWSGAGTRTFSEVSIEPGSTGGLSSSDGKTVYLTVTPPFFLEGTMSCSGFDAPTYACGPPPGPDGEPALGVDWSIQSGSTTDVSGIYQIEWDWCTPTPAFNSSLSPR